MTPAQTWAVMKSTLPSDRGGSPSRLGEGSSGSPSATAVAQPALRKDHPEPGPRWVTAVIAEVFAGCQCHTEPQCLQWERAGLQLLGRAGRHHGTALH